MVDCLGWNSRGSAPSSHPTCFESDASLRVAGQICGGILDAGRLEKNTTPTFLFWALIAGLAWAPFWLGGNRPLAWGVNGVAFPALALAYEAYLLATRRRHPVGFKQIGVAATLFFGVVCWIAIQATSWVAPPMAHPIWGMAAEALDRSIDGTISVNPGQSTLSLIRLLTVASAFWLSLQLCRDAPRAHLLLRALSLVISGYSAYSLVLSAFFLGEIPFFDAPGAGAGVVRSTFVNRNNFATYAGMGLVVTVALVLRSSKNEPLDVSGLWSFRLKKSIETTVRRGWVLLGAGLICLVALLGTLSRGGAISTLLALAVLSTLTAARRHGRRGERISIVLVAAAGLAAGFFFFGDAIVGRIAQSGLQDVDRASVYAIIVRSIFDTPLTGLGYGTFADVFPMYRDRSISTFEVWDKAHDTYLEVWQGLGVIFGSALIAAVGWAVAKCFKGAIGRRRDVSPAIAAAAVSVLVAVHALVDFSLQIDGIGLTYAAILGAGVAQSESSRISAFDRTRKNSDDSSREPTVDALQ